MVMIDHTCIDINTVITNVAFEPAPTVAIPACSRLAWKAAPNAAPTSVTTVACTSAGAIGGVDVGPGGASRNAVADDDDVG